jgi:Holliday junction resolvase-like predicted endonuclease
MDASSEGECDLVFEDENSILFVECKSKAVTSATMAGEPLEAVLDLLAAC